MEQKKGIRKVTTGLIVVILAVSVMSGAISATDNVSTGPYGVEDAGFTAGTVSAGESQAAKPPNAALFQSPPLGSYSHDSDLLKITVGEQSSSGWYFQYDPVKDPGNFIRSVYGEHYAIATDNWSGVIQSTTFTIDTYFGSVEVPDTATLHYGNLSLTRQVIPPEGSDKSFSITFVLTNTGNDTLRNVRFFQGIDYDISDSGNDYAWYSATSDTVWQNDDRYFKNGFRGSRISSHHDCNHYSSMWNDISSGVLNDLDKYPASGTADCGIALQWDAGKLAPGASWDLTITFYFGEAAGIEANAGPDQTVYRSEPVTFDASRSSSVGNITTYEWDFNNDSVYEVNVSTPIYLYGGFAVLGEHLVTLRVTDDAGRNDTDTVKITVVPNVDFLVSNLTFSPATTDGESVSIRATVRNNGTDPAPGFYVRFEVDKSYLGRKWIANLPAGNETEVTENWIAQAGSHNLTVVADEYNAIAESNETNNQHSKDLPFIQFPDLTVTQLSWSPSSPVSGNPLTFTATVKNKGPGSTVRVFSVRFEVDGSTIGHQVVSGLTANSSTNVTQPWTATWASRINVSVDAYNAVAESNETNNLLSTALPGLPFPDLIVTNLSWTAPEQVDAGYPITIAATIENTGGEFSSTMSRPLKVAFMVNGEQVGSRDIVGGLRAGQPLFTSFTWIAQPVTNPAVCVIADSSQIIPESNESNNQLCKPMSVVIASPDLTITQVTFNRTGTIHVGEIVQITAELKNIGIGNYSGDFEVGFFVNGTFIGVSGVASGLPADTSNFSTFNWIASSGSNPVVNARVDFFDIVRESNETNNEKTAIAPISIPYADLEITNITWTPTVNITDRDPVVFNVTVKNAGAENVITDFKVYFEIDRYFTRTNVISGGLAAGASTTTSFIWTATPGAGHNATAKADPGNIIPELNTTNNNRVQLLPFNVSFVEIFEVKVEPAVVTTGVGGETYCSVRIYNYGSAASTFTLSVGGLNATWCTFNPPAVYLLAGQQAVVDLRIAVPSACETSGTYPIQVSVTSQTTNLTKNVSASLMVESTPVLHELLPANRTAFGSTDVTFSWTTYTNASTTLYLKAEGDPAYTTYTGAEGLRHNVTVTDLARNTNYSYYAASTSACGTNQSAVRTFSIGNGISFTQNVYEFTVERDYNQRVTIAVQNTDNEYHELLVEVPITFEDLVLGFVGDGSQDNLIPLNPGKSKAVTLAVQCSDAMHADYEFTATLTSSTGTETLTDTAQVKIHVHVPAIDYELEELSVDNVTLMKTCRLTNTGDPITDLSISAADNFTANAYIEPVIEHYRLAVGESLEFHVIPILSSPDFQPHSPIPPVLGDIVMQGGGVQAKERINFTVPEGKQPYKAVVSSPGIINIGRVKTHHCNNNPNTKTPFDVHSGTKDKVRDDPLIIKFSTGSWEVRPHDIYVSINGHEVGSLINTIPEGYYKFEVDPAFLIYPEHGVAKNYIELHSVHQNGGHYLVSSDVEVRLNLINYETWVIASSQEEANQIAEANLPPGFYESPDNITIGSVDVTPEVGSAAPLGLTAGYPEVQIGRKTTIQTTAEPNLDVDARFSNGDGAVHLAEVSPGVYRGTWTPRNPGEPSTGHCVITIRAKGSGVQGEKTQTVKILNPTKLYISIIEPDDGSKISQIERLGIFGGDYFGVQPVRVQVTDDAGSLITAGDVQIVGSVEITKLDKTTTAQSLSTWIYEGNGAFRCDWPPTCAGDYKITVKVVDATSLGRASDTDSVTGTLEEAELKLENVKGPSGTIDPYWDYTKPPKEAFNPRIPTPYSISMLRCYCGNDFDISFTLNKKAEVKYEVYSKGPKEWFYGGPYDTKELGTFDTGDHTFSILNTVAYGDADYTYNIKLIAKAVDGSATDSDDSVVFNIERKPYFKVDKKAEYVNIEEPSVLSLAWFLGKHAIALFVGDIHAAAPIIWHVCIDPGVSSKDYEKIALVEEWRIEEYNWYNKGNSYVLHHKPNYEMPKGLTEQQAVLTPYPGEGKLKVESRTYYLEKRTKYYEMMPSENNTVWWSYEGAKLVNELGTWRLAKAGEDLSIYTKILVLAVQGGIEIADKVEVGDPKIVSEFVPQETEIIIYQSAYGYNPLIEKWNDPIWDRIETRSLESYEAKYGPRPKPAMNYDQIMNPTKKSHTSHDVLIDDTVSEATFYVCWNSSSLNKTVKLTIENPQGEVIDPVSANANTDVEYLTYITSIPDAEHQIIDELYRVKNPAAGSWKMNVSSLGTEPAEYYMCAFGDSEISLLFYTDKQVYGPNEQMVLEARLLYRDEPITAANVTTEIQRPDGSKESVTLLDDGDHDDYQADDGIYSNTYTNLSAEGEYWLNTNASGSTEKGEFRRATSVKKFVQDRPLVFIDTLQDAETIGGVVDITISAVDNSSIILSYEIWIDDVKVSNTNKYSWNTFSADGLHTIVGKATDAEGNLGTDEITVTVSNVPDPSDSIAPIAPTGVTISLVETGNALNLSWDPNVESDLAGYNTYRSYVSGGLYSKINVNPIKDTRYIDDNVYDDGLSGKRRYYYVITAVDDNHLESNFSQEVSGKPLGSWLETFDNDFYINASLSHNITIADGKLTLSAGSTEGYAISKAIKPESLVSWKSVYWLERAYGQITAMKISQDGLVWQIVSNGGNISTLDPARPLYYNCTMASDGVNKSMIYEILFTFTMDQEPIGFTGVLSDEGTDEDSNGLYDYLTIRVGVDIESPGYYYVVGDLKDKDGNRLFERHQSVHYLTQGNQAVSLKFEGETIYQHGVNGTLSLTNLELQDVQFHHIDELATTYITGVYNYTDFVHPPAQFADSFSDYGLDVDGDGQYDALIVNVGLTVESTGDYLMSGTLRDTAGHEIATASNVSRIAANASSVNLSLAFSGLPIWRHRVDGPYNLSNLSLLYQNETTKHVGYRAQDYTTAAYNYSGFEKPTVAFTSNFSDHGTDTDSDGKYDYLTIEGEVEIEDGRTYNLSGRLEDGTGTALVTALSTVNGTGKCMVPLNFDGRIISARRVNGPYYLRELVIFNTEDASSFDFMADAYTTSAYTFSDFETAPLDLSLTQADIAFSNDGPKVGDEITITATIHNDGTADAVDIVVQFFDGNPAAGGTQIGADQTIPSITLNSTETAQVNWTAVSGRHNIFVRIDPYGTIGEANETNNQAYKQIAVTGAPLPDLTLSPEDIQLTFASASSVPSSLRRLPFVTGLNADQPASNPTKFHLSEKAEYRGRLMDAVETINSSWTTSPPTIDGTMESGEWDGATAINITFLSGNCSMLVMNDGENMYLAFAVVSDTTNDVNDQDVVQLGFDGDHDNLIAPYGTLPFYANGTCVDLVTQLFGDTTLSWAGWLNMDENGTDCVMWYSPSNPTGPHVLATGFLGHRVYEYSVPLATALNVSPGDTVGFNALINDGLGTPDAGDFRTRGLWPSTWNGLCDFTADGDLVLATEPVTEPATLKATVHNIGPLEASDIVVQFFDGNPNAGGKQIGSDQTIASIPAGGIGHAEVLWDVTGAIGMHTIYVRVDPVDTIEETNEGNNQAFRDVGVPGVTCPDPAVSINAVETSVSDDPVGDGYNVSNAPANVDLSSAKGFMITATGTNGTYVFNITFLSPVSESFKLFKLPHWHELPYNVLDAYTIQVQLTIVGGVLDPAFILASVVMFDTGAPANPYPSISGTFNGTITPNQTLSVSQLYLYPCAGTGGHAEYAAFSYVNGTKLAEASWNGYKGDWDTLTFPEAFTLQANETYSYTIVTGSYPQIHHQAVLNTTTGTIRCTEFTDVNGRVYTDWIPAIRLF